MKTATVPSGPAVDKLIEVSTDVTLALEALEQHSTDSVFQAMEDGVTYGMFRLTNSYTDLTPQQLKVVKACMAEGIDNACRYVIAHINVHERHLGLCTEHSPACTAKVATDRFGKYMTTLWDDVNS